MITAIGIGNAITDIPVFIPSNSLLEEFKFLPGSMNHIDGQMMGELWKKVQGMELQYIAGGSAANTVAALQRLGTKCRFVGKIGRDAVGEKFVQGHRGDGVDLLLLKGEQESGRAITFISGENGERTFATCLGAALEFAPQELNAEMFCGYDLLHIEGYLLQAAGVVERAMEIAKGMGMRISLDLGSEGIVRRYKEVLMKIVADYADIVFANEQEAQAFSGKGAREAAGEIEAMLLDGATAKGRMPVAVVKLGAEGSLIQTGEEFYRIAPYPADAVDTTGAGDAYAAGFLYAFMQDVPVDVCGRCGSFLASKVVASIGPKIPNCGWKVAKEVVDSIIELKD